MDNGCNGQMLALLKLDNTDSLKMELLVNNNSTGISLKLMALKSLDQKLVHSSTLIPPLVLLSNVKSPENTMSQNHRVNGQLTLTTPS